MPIKAPTRGGLAVKNMLHYSKYCYYIEEKKTAWEDSEHHCYEAGPLAVEGGKNISHLANLDSINLRQAIKGVIKLWYSSEEDMKEEGYWIGVKREGMLC